MFWSAEVPDFYDWDVLHPMRVTLRATSDEQTVETSYARRVVADDVTEHVVAEEGVAGRLFLPERAGRGVVVVGGSDGGPGGPVMAALLAGHGLPVLSMAYWGHPGTPDALRDIDVEVVARACDWLRAQDGVDDVPPCVVGLSRGGELVLLAAALDPRPRGPGASSRWAAGSPGARGGRGPTCWRRPGGSAASRCPRWPRTRTTRTPASTTRTWWRRPRSPFERAAGPVLMLSGEDDAMWPSARLTRIAEARAEREGAGDRVTHVAYPGAGHFCTTPPGFPLVSEDAIRSGGSRSRQPGRAARRVATDPRVRGSGPMSEFQDGIGHADDLERLWTPYRMAYIRGENKPADGSEGECPFCRIPGLDDEAGLVVRRGETAYAVLNLYPYTAGHLMVCPYRHIADYTEVTDEESAEIGAMTRAAMRTVRAVSHAEGFNLGMNQGTAGGAGIRAHLHQHVVPRWVGDSNFMPVIGQTKTLPQLLQDTRALLAEAWD